VFYLQSRLHQLNKSIRFPVSVNGIPSLGAIENIVLPTIFAHLNQPIDNLHWEWTVNDHLFISLWIILLLNYHFDLHFLCSQIKNVFDWEKTENTRDYLRQFPIVDSSNSKQQQISPVSATFGECIVLHLTSLARITLSSHVLRWQFNLVYMDLHIQ
jgi:hypothetical protein